MSAGSSPLTSTTARLVHQLLATSWAITASQFSPRDLIRRRKAHIGLAAPDTVSILSQMPLTPVAPTPVVAQPERTSRTRAVALGIVVVVGVLAAGVFVATRGEASRMLSAAPSGQEREPHDARVDDMSGAIAAREIALLPPPRTELPNSPDTASAISQIFQKLNYGYRTGSTAYVDDAVLPDRTKGLSGAQTPLGKFWAQEIDEATFDANDYAAVRGTDPDGPLRIDETVLLVDDSDPAARKALLALDRVDTLGKDDQSLGVHYWIALVTHDLDLNADLMSGLQPLSGKAQADQILASADALRNWRFS